MDDLAAAVSIFAALSDVGCPRGPLQRLRSQLPAEAGPTGPTCELFRIDSDRNDAGAAVSVTAVRGDGRIVAWMVEAWIYQSSPGDWAVNVKAEIDLDDHNGDPWCVLNEQKIVTDSAVAAGTVERAAELVTGYPREDLLTAGWEPPDWTTFRGDPDARSQP